MIFDFKKESVEKRMIGASESVDADYLTTTVEVDELMKSVPCCLDSLHASGIGLAIELL